jgi:hypothetical protein
MADERVWKAGKNCAKSLYNLTIPSSDSKLEEFSVQILSLLLNLNIVQKIKHNKIG